MQGRLENVEGKDAKLSFESLDDIIVIIDAIGSGEEEGGSITQQMCLFGVGWGTCGHVVCERRHRISLPRHTSQMKEDSRFF